MSSLNDQRWKLTTEANAAVAVAAVLKSAGDVSSAVAAIVARASSVAAHFKKSPLSSHLITLNELSCVLDEAHKVLETAIGASVDAIPCRDVGLDQQINDISGVVSSASRSSPLGIKADGENPVAKTLEKQFNYQFKTIETSCPLMSVWGVRRFHPMDTVLAYSNSTTVKIMKGANGSIPFSDWKIEQEFKGQTLKEIQRLEWNVNGTQLAAGCEDGTVIVWSYPSGRILFEENKYSNKHLNGFDFIIWNPFRQNILATHLDGDLEFESVLLFWNSRENEDAKKAKHFLTLQRDEGITSVAWISANQIAIALDNHQIEICEMDADKGTSRVIKRFRCFEISLVNNLKWNERTKYLAVSSIDGWIKIWSMDSDQPVHTLQVHSTCRKLAWRPNGKTDDDGEVDAARKQKENLTFACGLSNESVVIWSPLEEEEANRKRFLTHNTRVDVCSLSFSPDGRFLASASFGRELIIWSTETWLPLFTFKIDKVSFAWMSTDSSSVPANKLAVTSRNKICVIEASVTDSAAPGTLTLTVSASPHKERSLSI